MLTTKPAITPLTGPTFNPKDRLKGMVSVQPQVLDDYLWGRRFGRAQHEGGMVWKYGNPWLYPQHEFEQLKTIVLTAELAQEKKENSKLPTSRGMTELTPEIKQKRILAAKIFHQAMRDG